MPCHSIKRSLPELAAEAEEAEAAEVAVEAVEEAAEAVAVAVPVVEAAADQAAAQAAEAAADQVLVLELAADRDPVQALDPVVVPVQPVVTVEVVPQVVMAQAQRDSALHTARVFTVRRHQAHPSALLVIPAPATAVKVLVTQARVIPVMDQIRPQVMRAHTQAPAPDQDQAPDQDRARADLDQDSVPAQRGRDLRVVLQRASEVYATSSTRHRSGNARSVGSCGTTGETDRSA